MLLKSFENISVKTVKTQSQKPVSNTGFVTQITGDSKYVVKDVTGRVVYGVRGPAGINRGSNISFNGSGNYSSISGASSQALPEIIDIEV